MVDAHGNIGNPLDPRTATPASEKAQMSLNTQRYEAALPGIGNILFNMQNQINTLQAAVAELQTSFSGHTHGGVTTGAGTSGAAGSTTKSAGSQLNLL